MPQKYGKGRMSFPKDAMEAIEKDRETRRQKKRARMFKAEPEELAILDAINKLPPNMRGDAAEGALIARVAKRKGLIR